MSRFQWVLLPVLVFLAFGVVQLGFGVYRWAWGIAPRFMHSGHEDVRQALDLAAVRPGELVADLGCGDGRAVVTAARDFGARGRCVERDPNLVMDARANLRMAGVADQVEVVQGDLFEADLSGVDVVFLYLTPAMNERLAPLLMLRLRPGARVVSISHELGSVPVVGERRFRDEFGRDRVVRLYVVQSARGV